MQQLKPTYLCSLNYGPSKGSINSNNAVCLPFGFTGLFEEEFQAKIPYNERSNLLRRLSNYRNSFSDLKDIIGDTKALIDRFIK